MPTLQTIMLFMASALALNLTPGPAILFILSRCLSARGVLRPWSRFSGSYSPIAFDAIKYCGAAYLVYIPRIGKQPGPMLDDYGARVSEGVVWVIEEQTSIAGIIVLLPRPDYPLLDNIAVIPTRQGFGLGRRLLAFAEAEAVRRGYPEIRLYTHQTMTENQRLYTAIGYDETGRGNEAGYERVFMRKRLARPSTEKRGV